MARESCFLRCRGGGAEEHRSNVSPFQRHLQTNRKRLYLDVGGRLWKYSSITAWKSHSKVHTWLNCSNLLGYPPLIVWRIICSAKSDDRRWYQCEQFALDRLCCPGLSAIIKFKIRHSPNHFHCPSNVDGVQAVAMQEQWRLTSYPYRSLLNCQLLIFS